MPRTRTDLHFRGAALALERFKVIKSCPLSAMLSDVSRAMSSAMPRAVTMPVGVRLMVFECLGIFVRIRLQSPRRRILRQTARVCPDAQKPVSRYNLAFGNANAFITDATLAAVSVTNAAHIRAQTL
jgi:hypothetical protein